MPPFAVAPVRVTDETVIGTPFYVMEMVEGRIFWNVSFPEVSAEERPDYFDAMNATIAKLHAIDWKNFCTRLDASWIAPPV